ncbi:predicted protein [Uncinocarpus reesii 1704]|uniref:AMP-dependent synthetase/ligase domain-containing protein n=1 Tax=Uncinocarpus reesii (strain UAMH 1704) TaxID=336963 RepID=C4JLT7_UNCRE|nr:uncharacterized protein UREG_03795 [Uncinocarpus reesii 1704]EEP78949.1 predicted protein [Uncinocarpus reesii 1704]
MTGLMEYYNEHIRALPAEERDKYVNGFRSLQAVYTSGSVLGAPTKRFFQDLTGVSIRNAYGLTEMGGGVMATSAGSDCLKGCIGTPLPEITVKLSGGDEGEILVKSPNMFLGYVDDETATRAAIDNEGFFKTGDYARRVGDRYFLDGRVSCDWVRFHDFKIPILELEQCLMDLPYVSEAHVLPVLDHKAGGLVAALVRPQKSVIVAGKVHDITLKRIRDDLAAADVIAYKLPTLLRILKHGEQLPLTGSDKIIKRECLRQFFDISGYLPEQYAVDGVEYWGNNFDPAAPTRTTDWGML